MRHLFLLLTCAVSAIALGQPQPQLRVFSSVLALGQPGTGPSVAGGEEASSEEFPASFYFARSKDDHCSATVVGPRTIVTAAHCVQDLPGGRIGLAHANRTYTATCRISAHYSPSDNSYNFHTLTAADGVNTSADLALCLLDERVPGIRYDRMHASPNMDRNGERLLVTGFGCAGFAGIDRKNYRFRKGDTFAWKLPADNSYYIAADGNAAVCPGDSGGATYRVPGAGVRVLAGVNSRTNQFRTSYITSLTSFAAMELLRAWEQTHPNSICGRGSNDAGCS